MKGKNTLSRIVIMTAIVAVVSLGIAAVIGLTAGGFDPREAGRPGRSVDERKTIALDAVELLSVTSVSEGIRVIEGSTGSVEAWLHGTVGAGSGDSVPRLETARNGTTAEIRLETDRRFGIGPFWNNIVLEVRIPKEYRKGLSVKAVSGGIDVSDHPYAGLSLLTTSGDVHVGSVETGELALHTTSGKLTLGNATARIATITSVSGDVEGNVRSGEATVHTTSGDVRLGFAALPVRIDASSTSGTVTLVLPAAAGFTLDARSTSGDISCKFPITVSESQAAAGRHALQGVVQSGSGMVAAHTVSGDIRIER
jgi:lia operon protein LiaG